MAALSPTLRLPYLKTALPYGQSILKALTYLNIKERKNHKEKLTVRLGNLKK
jgi:hypothetical protein